MTGARRPAGAHQPAASIPTPSPSSSYVPPPSRSRSGRPGSFAWAQDKPEPRPGRARPRFLLVLPVLALLCGALGLFQPAPAEAQTKTFKVSPWNLTVEENGTLDVPVRLSEAAPFGGVKFTVKVVHGSTSRADFGADDLPTSGTVPWRQTSAKIATFPMTTDLVYEGTETFQVEVTVTTAGWTADPNSDADSGGQISTQRPNTARLNVRVGNLAATRITSATPACGAMDVPHDQALTLATEVPGLPNGGKTWVARRHKVDGGAYTAWTNDGQTSGGPTDFELRTIADWGATRSLTWQVGMRPTEDGAIAETSEECTWTLAPPVTVTLEPSRSVLFEGSHGIYQLQVSVKLSRVLADAVTIPLTVTPGTAETDDYDFFPTTVTVPAGELSFSRIVLSAQQDADQDDETFTLAIDAANLPAGFVAGTPSSALVTILDDDGGSAPGRPTGLRAVPGDTVMQLTWTAPSGTARAYDVHYTRAAEADVSNEAAGLGSGDPATGWRIVMQSREPTSFRVIDLPNDRLHRFRVRAVNGGGAGPWAFVTGTPTVPLPTVSLSVSPNPVPEGDPVTVTATLSKALAGDVTIPLTLTDDTAEAGDRGTLASIAVTAGETTGTGTITTVRDADADAETFTVALDTATLPSEVTAGSPSSVQVTISDDDTPSLPPGTIWSGTLTVGGDAATRGCTNEAAASGQCTTLLSDDEFTLASTEDYFIYAVSLHDSSRLSVSITDSVSFTSRDVTTALDAYKFCVGTREFSISSAAHPQSYSLSWSGTGLSWSDGDTVELSIASSCTPPTVGGPTVGGPTVGGPTGGGPTSDLTLSDTAFELYETGNPERFTVALATAPQADVTVAVVSADPTRVTATPAQVVFTRANWNQPQSVTLTALADPDDVDRESVTVTLTPRSTTGNFDPAQVTVTHREVPPVEVLLSLALAKVREGDTLAVTVSLSAAPRRVVTVPLVATPGTATTADYTVAPLSVTFDRDETAKTVIVSAVADELADEPDETVQLAVGATLPPQVTAGAHAQTEVTIEDRTRQAAAVRAWTARFGRTAATHVTDAVGDRLRATPGQASSLTIGGYHVPLGTRATPTSGPETEPAAGSGPAEAATAVLTEVARVLGMGPGAAPTDTPGRERPDPRLNQGRTLALGQTVTLRQVLLGSAFRLNLNGAADAADASHPRLTAWGRVAGTTFDGQDGALALDGDVFTGTVGVDGTWDRWLAGVAVAHSRGDGAFTDATPGLAARGRDRGGLEQTLTSIHPYVRYAVTDRLDVWGLVGYGWGEVDLELANEVTVETDAQLVMGAFGGRGMLLAPGDTGGFQLATRTDAMLTRTSTDATAQSAATDADAHRLRLVLEGSRAVTWADGRTFTPTMELGLRHDWGDAETGFGLEVGGRVQYADPALGLTIEGTVRGLVAHEDDDYQEWGASGTVRLAPGATGQGLSLTLAPAWGAAASGVDGLWARQTTAGLAPSGATPAQAGRLQADVGYGLALFDLGLLTPYAGTVLAESATRTYRVGTRWASVTGLSVHLEGTRQDAGGLQPVNQGLRLQVQWGF